MEVSVMAAVLNDLDNKLLEHFRGYVVKKDLVSSVKVGANVPVFVLEYLIANSCSTDDEEKIRIGMENVKRVLSEHYVNPEESSLIQSKIREKGRFKIIDKISVELDSKKDIYWAKLQNSNIKNVNISDDLVKHHEKMLMGGIWAIIDVEYDPNIRVGQNIFPFVITEIKPIQLSSFDNTKIMNKRKEFTKSEWLDVLLRSCGYEPSAEGVSDRIKMLLLSRLLPMVESNFNFIELGPRSTGKSFVFKELTPYAVLISGGQGTVAKLFVHGSTGKVGAVGQWDAICFDEATDKIFKDRDAVPLMKDYMESGSFSRAGAGGEITGVASIILNGNINQPVETVLQTSHLFSPLSDEVNSDTAFLDRIHFYLPGWEMIKFAPKHFTSSFGFSTDYFSEALKSLRRVTYTDAIEKYFSLGSHLKQRDTKPVKKTVSGFIKLLHPDGEYTKEDIKDYLEIALEMRRRVKEQLKRIGGMEFWDTNFSYIDKESQEEFFVGLPEEKGSNLIENTPLSPGICYTSTSDGENVALVRIETVAVAGSGKLNITGVNNMAVKENIKNTYQYIKANEKAILSDRHSLNNYDISIQVTNLLGAAISSGIGSAVYIAIVSALYKKNLKAGLAVLGNISVGGAIERVINFADKVTMLSENGAKSVIVPMDNLNELSNVPPTVLGTTDVPFYQNNQMLMQKAILMD
jgi:ATP-dependent Lon protease